MNRKIKFRAWDKLRRKIIEWKELSDEPGDLKVTILSDFFNNEDLIFMQYTGLKDKNDKEIYEGHIVKSIYPDIEHKIIFDKDTAMFGYYYKSIYGKSFCGLYRHLKDIEIIGNIYKNPELLEVKDD